MDAQQIASRLVDGKSYSVRTYRSEAAERGAMPPFTQTRLFVMHHKGVAVTLTPKDYDWAEFDPRQESWIEGDMLRLIAEDYCMDIEISSIHG